MKNTIKTKKGHNWLTISLSGDQRYVKIFNTSGELIRHSQTKGKTEIIQMVEPGEYMVETDGTIKELRSMYIDVGAMDDPNLPVNQ